MLPVAEIGLIGGAAQAFRKGFIHAANIEGENFLLQVYPTESNPENVVEIYRQAVADSADMVVGPMLKSNVEKIRAEINRAPVPTLALQPVEVFDFDESPMYGFSLDAGAEAGMVAKQAFADGFVESVLVIDDSPFGNRLADGFSVQWTALSGKSPQRYHVGSDDALLFVHSELRNRLALAEEGEGAAYGMPRTMVFVAGDAGFARKVRAHVPTALPMFVPVLANEGGGSLEATMLEGVRLYEMPWIADPTGDLVRRYDDLWMREASMIEQRFFAMGVDAFRLVQELECWKSGCAVSGIGGWWQMDAGGHNFRRRGVAVRFTEGSLESIESTR